MRQLRFLFQFPVLDVVFDQEPVKMGVYVVTDDTLLSRLSLLMCMHVHVRCSFVLERAFRVGPLCPNAVHAARKFPSLSYVVFLRSPCYVHVPLC